MCPTGKSDFNNGRYGTSRPCEGHIYEHTGYRHWQPHINYSQKSVDFGSNSSENFGGRGLSNIIIMSIRVA